MIKLARGLIIAAILGLLCTALGTRPASAQDAYWNNHWQWYDNTYHPYYRRYYYTPTYAPTYYGPTYSATPHGYYYGAPATYYNNYGPSYVQPYFGTQVGPVRYGWW